MRIKRFSTIVADPPWMYRDKCHAGERGAIYKYPLMTDEDVAALPVRRLAAPDTVLFLWATWPKLPVALDVMAAWGFRYKTAGLVWVKVAQKQGRARAKMAGARDVRRVQEISPLVDGLAMPRLAWGMGHWSRANTEFCLLGTRGRPRTRSHSIHQVIHAPPAEHSAKPPIARTLIAALAAAPRIELFARGQTPRGWHAWGNQAEGDRVLPPSALAR